MGSDWPSTIVGSLIGGSAISGLVSLATWATARKKAPAEKDSIIVDSATDVVRMLRDELDHAGKRIEACETQTAALLTRATTAEKRADDAHDELDQFRSRLARRDETIRTLRERIEELERLTGVDRK